MLARKYRLTKESDFNRVFRSGNKVFSRFFNLRYCNGLAENSRFAVVVANKVSKKAVQRNLLKRQTRAIIHLNLDKIVEKMDILVNVLPVALGVDYQELEQDLIAAFKKAKLM